MRTLQSLPFLFSLIVPLCAAAAADDRDEHLAPDGRPGLGTRSARELGALLRSPDERQRELLAGIVGLESDLILLRAEAARGYRERGYFELCVGAADPDLDDLQWRLLEDEPRVLEIVGAGGTRGEVFARAFLDLRLRLRLRVTDGFERESRDVRAGLALLRATQDGYVNLKDPEARAIAARVDLSCAVLRAMRLDLEALREGVDERGPGAPDPAWVAELSGIADMDAPAGRRAALARLERKLSRRESQMSAALFTPRQREHLAVELARREAALERTAAALPDVLLLVPESKEGRAAPEEIAALARHRRYGHALRRAVEGLGDDPLSADLSYWAGVASDFLYGALESRGWFDRYLALRGIRSSDHRTYQGRRLSAAEERALEVVQRPLR